MSNGTYRSGVVFYRGSAKKLYFIPFDKLDEFQLSDELEDVQYVKSELNKKLPQSDAVVGVEGTFVGPKPVPSPCCAFNRLEFDKANGTSSAT
jgi:hypothetical protein